jgi:hypothetical protein
VRNIAVVTALDRLSRPTDRWERDAVPIGQLTMLDCMRDFMLYPRCAYLVLNDEASTISRCEAYRLDDR